MTRNTLSLFDPFNFANSTVGFDSVLERLNELTENTLKNVPNYPPYNIKKIDDNKYEIELAVAGFGTHNLSVEMNDGKLVISGEMKSEDENNTDGYLYKGISTRAFKRAWTLADTVEIQDAHLVNGMLRVVLENMIPESKKPRKIEINTSKTEHFETEKQLLTENDL